MKVVEQDKADWKDELKKTGARLDTKDEIINATFLKLSDIFFEDAKRKRSLKAIGDNSNLAISTGNGVKASINNATLSRKAKIESEIDRLYDSIRSAQSGLAQSFHDGNRKHWQS